MWRTLLLHMYLYGLAQTFTNSHSTYSVLLGVYWVCMYKFLYYLLYVPFLCTGVPCTLPHGPIGPCLALSPLFSVLVPVLLVCFCSVLAAITCIIAIVVTSSISSWSRHICGCLLAVFHSLIPLPSNLVD